MSKHQLVKSGRKSVSKEQKEIKERQEELELMELKYRQQLMGSQLAIEEYYRQQRGIHFR